MTILEILTSQHTPLLFALLIGGTTVALWMALAPTRSSRHVTDADGGACRSQTTA